MPGDSASLEVLLQRGIGDGVITTAQAEIMRGYAEEGRSAAAAARRGVVGEALGFLGGAVLSGGSSPRRGAVLERPRHRMASGGPRRGHPHPPARWCCDEDDVPGGGPTSVASLGRLPGHVRGTPHGAHRSGPRRAWPRCALARRRWLRGVCLVALVALAPGPAAGGDDGRLGQQLPQRRPIVSSTARTCRAWPPGVSASHGSSWGRPGF